MESLDYKSHGCRQGTEALKTNVLFNGKKVGDAGGVEKCLLKQRTDH